jgi:hypothetical protein
MRARVAFCAAFGKRRSSGTDTGSGGPIANRPQINNLPHKFRVLIEAIY